jgi:hypothetical protein
LITKVGFEVSGKDPIRLVAVASTIMNWSSSESVGVKVADVAPEISVHEPRSAGSVQLFHWYVIVGVGEPLNVTFEVKVEPT